MVYRDCAIGLWQSWWSRGRPVGIMHHLPISSLSCTSLINFFEAAITITATLHPSFTKPYLMAPFVHWSTHVPQSMHSSCSMELACTICSTSRLIGQCSVHVWQFLHWAWSAFRWRDGHAGRFRSLLPSIIKGAIQHTWWQNDRLPTISDRITNSARKK